MDSFEVAGLVFEVKAEGNRLLLSIIDMEGTAVIERHVTPDQLHGIGRELTGVKQSVYLKALQDIANTRVIKFDDEFMEVEGEQLSEAEKRGYALKQTLAYVQAIAQVALSQGTEDE